MSLVTCPFGHYYDDVKNNECPVCKRQQNFTGKSYDIQSQVTVSSYKFGNPTGGITELLNADDMKQVDFDKFELKETYDAMSDENSTIGFFDLLGVGDYTAGWLVCTNGSDKGMSFTIRIGQNTIGTVAGNDFLLSDRKVLKNRHCSVVYEPKQNKFFIVPGSGAVFFNDKFISEPCVLKNGDRIILGESEFVFVPFCNNSRRWDL